MVAEIIPFARVLSPASRAKGRRSVAKKFKRLERLTTVYVAVADLKPNPWNPNRQSDEDFELLLRSIEDNGFTVPIVVNRDTMQIVDGEHRWRAAQALGMDEIPVVYVDQTIEQQMTATLTHNRARGTEDVGMTAALLRDLQSLGALGAVQDSLNLTDADIALMIDNVNAPDLLAGDDFGDAWVPEKGDVDHASDGSATSMTDAGADAVRKRESALSTARSPEERARAMTENKVYRISLVFNGDEAAIVQAVLGDRPAVRLLELCRSAVA
jgi:ParB/RepB/Spo0J family partition protein